VVVGKQENLQKENLQQEKENLRKEKENLHKEKENLQKGINFEKKV